MGGSVSVSLSLSASVRITLSWSRYHPADPSGEANQGLRPPQIRDLPVLVLPNKPSSSSSSSFPLLATEGGGGCPVCLEQFAGGQEVRILPRCRHAYHRPCIDRWLLRSGNCPVCRDRPIHPGLASIIEAATTATTSGLPS